MPRLKQNKKCRCFVRNADISWCFVRSAGISYYGCLFSTVFKMAVSFIKCSNYGLVTGVTTEPDILTH